MDLGFNGNQSQPHELKHEAHMVCEKYLRTIKESDNDGQRKIAKLELTRLCVRLVRDQDEKGFFAYLFNIYGPLVFFHCQHNLNVIEPQDIYDLIQKTFIKAWEKRKQLRNPDAFGAWLISIAENENKDIHRKNKRLSKALSEYSNYIHKRNTNTNRLSEFRELLETLKDEMDRNILFKYYIERQTDKQIGRILHINADTVKKRRYRILNKLREQDEYKKKT